MMDSTQESNPLPFTLIVLLFTLMLTLALLGWLGLTTVKELTAASVQALAGGAVSLSLKAVLK